MKARLISVLLVIALLVTVGVITAQAEEVTGTAADGNKVYAQAIAMPTLSNENNIADCPACGATGVTWEALTAITAETKYEATEHKHYYVPEGGLTNTGAYRFEKGTYCIHLNGNNITSTSSMAITVRTNATANIMGDGVVTGAATSEPTCLRNAGYTNLYGGTWQDTKSSSHATVAAVQNELKIYAGTVIEPGKNANGTVYDGRNLIVTGVKDTTGGNAYMYGGIIRNGRVPSGTWGSNVGITPAGTKSISFVMYGGEISGGYNAQHGGNIAIQSSSKTGQIVFRMYGGEIKDGEAGMCGGNIYVTRGTTAGKLIISSEAKTDVLSTATGTKVTGGVAGRVGGNLYVLDDNTTNDTFMLLYVGEISGGKSTGTNSNTMSGRGGNIYFGGKTKTTFSLRGMEVSDGEAKTLGGNIYVESGTVQIGYKEKNAFYSTVKDGVAEKGGNIYNAGTLDLTAYGTVSGGEAGNGGSIYNEGTAKIAGTVNGGEATAADGEGGAIFTTDGTTTITGTVQNGKASYGGNICCDTGSVVNMNSENAVIENGEAIHGGNVYVRSEFTMSKGVIRNGVVSSDGNGIYARAGAVNLLGGTVISNVTESKGNIRQGSVVLGGTAKTKTETVDGVDVKTVTGYNAPVITIGGDFTINAQIDNEGIWLNDYSQMIVNEGFAGSVKVRTIGNFIPAYGAQYGVNECTEAEYTPAVVVSATGAFSGTIALPQRENAPALFVTAGEGLEVAGAQVDGQWVAADAVTNGTNVKLYADATMTLADGANSGLVDLNGKNLTVNGTGNGTFTGFNSSSAEASQVTLNGATTEDETTWNDAGYYNVVLGGEEGVYTYHKLEMAMKSISLRPSVAGLYYTSQIKADETLAGMIQSAGVLLGATDDVADLTTKMQNATADDLSKKDAAFVGVAPETLNLSAVTSVVVKNIFKEGADNNAQRGQISVVGTPYVKFANNLLVCQDVADCSMRGFLEAADTKVTDAEKLVALKKFCDKWSVSEFGWTLPNIMAVVIPAEPEEQV